MFGAEVIRVEDPTTQGRWDMMRLVGPYVDERRGVDLGGGFNNHNVNKLGVTLNLKDEDGRELLATPPARCATSSPRTSPPACSSGSASATSGSGRSAPT